MGEVRTETGETTMNAGVTSLDVALVTPITNVSQAFVRISNAGNGNFVQTTASAGTAQNVSISAWVEILNATTLRFHTASTGIGRFITWEVWEFIGTAGIGDPDEFVVRQVGSTLLNAVNIFSAANPWTMTNSRDNFLFSRGLSWSGAGAGAISAPSLGQVCMYCFDFGAQLATWQRGVHNASHLPTIYWTAVEFIGSRWEQRWVVDNTHTPGTVQTHTLLNAAGAASAIPSWSNAIAFGTRRQSNNIDSSCGWALYPGTSTANVRRVYIAFGSSSATLDTLSINVLYHPSLVSQHNSSLLGSGTSFAAHTGQQVDTTAITTLPVLTRAAAFGFTGLVGGGATQPAPFYSSRLKSDGAGGHEIEWVVNGTNVQGSTWSYFVADFQQNQTVSANMALALTQNAARLDPLRDVHADMSVTLVEAASVFLLETDEFTVMRGETVFGASADFVDVTLPEAVVLSAAFERICNVNHVSAGPNATTSTNRTDEQLSAWVELTSTTNLRVSRLASASDEDVVVSWEVVSYKGDASGGSAFAVHGRFSVAFPANGAGSTSQTVSFVGDLGYTLASLGDVLAVIRGVGSEYNADAGPARRLVALRHREDAVDGAVIDVTRAVDGAAATVYCVAVEFTGANWSLHQGVVNTASMTDFAFGDHPLQTTDGVTPSAFPVPSWSQAMIFQTSWAWDPIYVAPPAPARDHNWNLAFTSAASTSNVSASLGDLNNPAGLPTAAFAQVLHNSEWEVQRGTYDHNVITFEVAQTLGGALAPGRSITAASIRSTQDASASGFTPPSSTLNWRLLSSTQIETRLTRVGFASMFLPVHEVHYEGAAFPGEAVSWSDAELRLTADPWAANALRQATASMALTLVADPWAVFSFSLARVGFVVRVTDPTISVATAASMVAAALSNTNCPASVAGTIEAVMLATADLPVEVSVATIAVQIAYSTASGTSGDPMATLSLCPASVDICVTRDDSTPWSFTITDDATTPAAIDITGFSFLLTVNTEEDPTDTSNQLFQLTGTVTSGAGGVVQFSPTTELDQTPGDYFFDVQMTTGAGDVRTIIKGGFAIRQDITK